MHDEELGDTTMRSIAIALLTFLLALPVFAADHDQTPEWVVHDVIYQPATASDTDLTINTGGRTLWSEGMELLRWDLVLIDTLSIALDDSNYAMAMQASLWGSPGYNTELSATTTTRTERYLQWDSVAAFDTLVGAGDFPVHKVLAAADSIWHYQRLKIRVRWNYHFDDTDHWDTDSSFTNTPIFHNRLVARYD